MTRKSTEEGKKVAFFAGSFNPFTVGHLSIVERLAPLFDKVIVAVGCNWSKNEQDSDQVVDKIKESVGNIPNVTVISYSGLTVDAAKAYHATVLVRGVRDVADYEKEKTMADVNRAIGNMETLLMFALPQYSFISSSLVRELEHYGSDVSSMLPHNQKNK